MKSAIVFFLVMTFLNITSCSLSNEDVMLIDEANMQESVLDNDYSYAKDISLVLEDVYYSTQLPEYLEATLVNNSDTLNCKYGEHFWLEKRLADKWYTFPPSVAIDIAYTLNHNEKKQIKLYIAQYHEHMSTGLYRIVCPVDLARGNGTKIVECEFSIEGV